MIRISLGTLLLLAAALALYGLRPPPAAGLEAPVAEFSAARAMEHLSQFATRPHPIGTEANRQARDYLVRTLTSLGGNVRVEDSIGIYRRERFVRGGVVHNIVATFPGSANSRALLLVAHYDSVPEGPGAGDDGAGVISILESLRALRAGPALKNDLIVLLSDGEEAGLLGASAFAADHPDLPARVGVALNADARGSSGPVLMFQTSDGNGWLVREFAQSAPYPTASSLMFTVYKFLPNDTDMSPLRSAGYRGLNSAFTETLEDYHSRLDTAENLDSRSVQQMGANLLGLTRRFGNLPLTDMTQPDAVYFNSLGHRLVHYPAWVIWFLTLANISLLALARRFGRARTVLQWKPTFVGLACFPILLAVIFGGIWLGWTALRFFLPGPLLLGDTRSNQLLFGGLLVIGFAFALALLSALGKKLGTANLAFGSLLALALLSAVIGWLLPGASYLFQWPALLGAVGLCLWLRINETTGVILCAVVAAIPALLILAPLSYLFFVGLNLNLASLAANALLLALLFACAWPVFALLVRPAFGVVAVLLLIALILLLAGGRLSHFSAKHPQRDSLIYSRNADRAQAKWISSDIASDLWTKQFLGANPSRQIEPAFTTGSDRICFAADAPEAPLAAPAATVISDQTHNGVRTLRLHLTSPRGANAIFVRVPAETNLLAVSWSGRVESIQPNEQLKMLWTLRFDALPSEGVDLELRFAQTGPLECWLADYSFGLPSFAGASEPPRPDWLMPASGSDVTLVAREVKF